MSGYSRSRTFSPSCSDWCSPSVAYKAYERERADFLLLTAFGFALLTLGTLTEALYEFSINRGFPAFGRELYLLRTAEAVIIALGFSLLIYSLRSV